MILKGFVKSFLELYNEKEDKSWPIHYVPSYSEECNEDIDSQHISFMRRYELLPGQKRPIMGNIELLLKKRTIGDDVQICSSLNGHLVRNVPSSSGRHLIVLFTSDDMDEIYWHPDKSWNPKSWSPKDPKALEELFSKISLELFSKISLLQTILDEEHPKQV
jgi:hypothetical protein